MTESGNASFMAGVPELLVLRLLREREMYGYEIVRAIRERTAGAVLFGEGVVYPLLHALAEQGALTARARPVNGRSRIYYALTPEGARRLVALTETWITLNQAVAGVLKGTAKAPATRA